MTMPLSDYAPIVGAQFIDQLKLLASQLNGKRIQTISSTAVGGGVAEILNRMMPLLQDLGVDAQWDVMQGSPAFFKVTKKFHNALQGLQEDITIEDLEVYQETIRQNQRDMELYGDVIFIHDPQPVALIEKKGDLDSKWAWRCHIDLSNPNERVWDFLFTFINRYDGTVFSAPQFSQPLPMRQFLISPSIDPLSPKNQPLPDRVIERVLDKYGIEPDRPIITQVSRFDYLKDPLGVIRAFRMVRRTIDCQLVLAGGTATDDPESEVVLAQVMEEAGNERDIHVLSIPAGSDLEINALQTASDIVLQKSIREGFGLTVSEALWKGKPVVASAVGGIPLQVIHNFSGLLVHTIEGTALAIKELLSNPSYARWLGDNGKEHVRHNFLLTRHLKDYLILFLSLGRKEDFVFL